MVRKLPDRFADMRCHFTKSSKQNVFHAYKYSSLRTANSIRLLSLFPAEGASSIHISLAEVRLREANPYEALSYAWATEQGDCERSSQIRCDSGYIWVTKNCEAALRRLRKRDIERLLWVDAICINQEDVEERGHQVGIMRDIYRNATGTLIWLGEESKAMDYEMNLPISSMILEFFGQAAAEIKELVDAKKDPTLSSLYQGLRSQATYGNLAKTQFAKGVFDISRRRWWKRLWVIQEVVVAKSATLICGQHSASYSDFLSWHRLINIDEHPSALALRAVCRSSAHLNSVNMAMFADNSADPLFTIFHILQRNRYLEATDPRDKIFGLLGLSKSFKDILPSPDYNQTPTKLFVEVTARFLSRSKSLYILTGATNANNSLDHPSWVTDWSKPPVLNCPTFAETIYNAARDSDSIYLISNDRKELRVKGKSIDFGLEIPGVNRGAYGNDSSDFSEIISGWQDSCRLASTLEEYPTGETVQEALSRTLCWNHIYPQGYSPAFDQILEHFEEWHSTLMSGDASRDKLFALSSLIFNNWLLDRALICTTARGYLASVPPTAKAGDCIAVLTGGRIPFVLRRTGNHYLFIGPCYVHGIMDGEAFPGPEEFEWFSIQ